MPLKSNDTERIAWVCLAALLLVGVPLFLCMPLWCDVSLYDVAARNVLEGGIHYRDVFDTNMPGIVWIHVLVRSVVGWSSEGMRLFDLLVVTGIFLVLVRWLREMGMTRAQRVWFAVGLFLLYFSLAEICHCQRDVWMLLPALLAVRVRCWRVAASWMDCKSVPQHQFVLAVLEGGLWGLGIWIKPHVLPAALMVWIATAVWISGREPGSLRRLVVDTLELVLGGVLVGVAGISWMLASGTWDPFWDVFLHWNPHYLANLQAELPIRYWATFIYFPPWSWIHLLALPVALWNLVASRFWSAAWREELRPNWQICQSRAILAALYLGWMGQTLYLQRAFQYVHVPEAILALALLSGQCWPVGQVSLAWFAAAAVVWDVGLSMPSSNVWLEDLSKRYPVAVRTVLPLSVLSRTDQLVFWPRCWTEGSTDEVRDGLAALTGTFPSTSWRELEEVAGYLREEGVSDEELVCWHDSTHPLYLMLRIKPAIRFMHVGTALLMSECYDKVRQELLEARAKRYVVSDPVRVFWSAKKAAQIGPGGWLDLPPALSEKQRHVFPFDQPIVFRSSAGRYLVHRIKNPIDRIDIPFPNTEE